MKLISSHQLFSQFSSGAQWVARHRLSALVFCIATFLCLVRPAVAQFEDVGYTLEPTVYGVSGGDDAAFADGVMYGGALGLSFGRYFQVSGEYVMSNELETDFSEIDRLDGLMDQNLEARRYGARLRFNLNNRGVIPFLTTGAGVLEFDPATADMSRTLYGLAGGGITFTAQDRYRISLGAELLNYRYDPVATFLGPAGAESFETGTQLVSVPALSGSLSLFLGGRSLEEQTEIDQALQQQFGGGLGGTQLLVHPFYGRVEFNDALGFPKDQNLAGVNAGVDLGPYVGLRGFYWRGASGTTVTDEFADDFEDIQLYGGEMQLRLNLDVGHGFVPYVNLGGGYLDVLSGYSDDIPSGTEPPDDRFFGKTGAGLEVPLSRTVKLAGGARALWMTNPNAAAVGGDPGDIYGSVMYTAGIEFRLGGGTRRPQPVPMPEPTVAPPAQDEVPAPQETPGPPPPQIPGAQTAATMQKRLEARIDSLQRVIETLRTAPSARAEATAPERSNVSNQTITVPVPEQGEVYLRYGNAPGSVRARPDTVVAAPQGRSRGQDVSTGELERRVQDAVREAMPRPSADTAAALSEAQIERVVDQAIRRALNQQPVAEPRVETGPDPRIRQLEREIDRLQRMIEEQSDASVPPRTAPAQTPPRSPGEAPFYREMLGRPLTYAVPMVGVRGGDGPNQVQIGIRGDYRYSPSSRFHVEPELTLGLGGGYTLSPNLLANVSYSFLRKSAAELTGAPIEPFVGAGVGFSSNGGFTIEPVTNLMLGVDYRLPDGRVVVLEYSTLDIFNTHRFHVGYRFRL